MKGTMVVAMALLGAIGASSAASVDTAALAEQVKAAETAFAGAMAARNLDAFAVHISDEAVFYGRESVTRGKAAVVASWKPLFEGPKAPFSWAPESVEVLDSGTLALSAGPVRNADGKQIGTFNSIWRREADGTWKVVFDKGCPVCEDPSKP
jgi:ketosteroid isomerase-like protein